MFFFQNVEVLLSVKRMAIIDVNNKIKNLLCLILVGLWRIDYLCHSPIVNLNSGLTRVQHYGVIGAQVVNDPHVNQH